MKRAIAVGLCTLVGVTLAAAQNKDSHDNQQFMHIHNLYADENGDTHFRDINAEPANTYGKGHISQAVDGKFRHSVFVTLD
jgi:hypothetical protein